MGQIKRPPKGHPPWPGDRPMKWWQAVLFLAALMAGVGALGYFHAVFWTAALLGK